MTYFLFGRSRWPSAPRRAGLRVGPVGKKKTYPLISWQATLAKPFMLDHHQGRKDSSDMGPCLPAEVLRESPWRLHGCSHHVFDSPIAFTEDVAPSSNVPAMDQRKTTAPMVRHWEGLS